MDKITDEQIEQMKSSIREKNGYDKMSNEEKKSFDEKLDKSVEAQKKEWIAEGKYDGGEKKPVEPKSEKEAEFDQKLEEEKNKFREKNGYDKMTDEEKKAFDAKLDKAGEALKADWKKSQGTKNEGDNADDGDDEGADPKPGAMQEKTAGKTDDNSKTKESEGDDKKKKQAEYDDARRRQLQHEANMRQREQAAKEKEEDEKTEGYCR